MKDSAYDVVLTVDCDLFPSLVRHVDTILVLSADTVEASARSAAKKWYFIVLK